MPSRFSVRSFQITQATTHLFRDLYVYNTMLILVRTGSKSVRLAGNETLEASPGELLIFPSGSFITIENRITSGGDYRAHCVSYPDAMIEAVFGLQTSKPPASATAIAVGRCPADLAETLVGIGDIPVDGSAPEAIVRHRLLEPLVWLKALGVELASLREKPIDCALRDLIASDPSRKWRSREVAKELGHSEATLRRRLQERQASFSAILMAVRLEHGLTLLQTTRAPISRIALECGFSTPSHFSDAFRARFAIQPKLVRSA